MRAELLLALSGCTSDEATPVAEPLVQASATVTPATVAGLGPHRFVTITERSRPGHPEQIRTEVVEVEWIDLDNFQIRRLRDGALGLEVRVLDNRAYSRNGDERFAARQDAGIYKNELWTAFGAFDQALEPFGERVQLGEGEDTLVEGRPALQVPISLKPAPMEASPSRGHQPVALQGTLVLDKASAVPVSGEAQGSYLERGRADREITVKVRLTRSAFGTVPQIDPPDAR